jgi:hypothetical protein
MRRRGTWLVVGALIALGAIAAADTLRGGQDVTVAPQGKAEQPAATVAQPGEPTMSGALYYSDANDDCRLSGVTVPDLGNPAFDPSTGAPPKLRSCSFSMSPDGQAALQGDVAWSPSGSLHARETRNTIRLGSASDQTLRFRGRAPAFKQDGTLTYVPDGKLVEWRGRVVFSMRDLRKTVPGHRSLGPMTLRDVAWLTDTRLAAVVGVDAGTPAYREFFAVVEGKRVLATHGSFFGEGHTIEASPGGGYFAEWFRDVLLGVRDRDGREMVFPTVQGVRALTWSPDERWAAVASRFSVFVFRTDEGEARIRRLPIVARDLAWR